ncbi:glycosyltransferase [Ancylobacter oerskovii]|uniref:Glycosyltransferase n=1 Tax=Ancylobacter oerskovii TaxID=459519 RepID=A0ABW4YWA6_9HYPH|nr:glycosyltransferase [Ancylobacter oerskovii]MBS7544284.1 glycosyltransferase [Ancylobacter oerskovii]
MTVSIAIATADFAGPVRNGGVGTALRGLAETLVDAGHKVTVIYANPNYEVGDGEMWRESLGREGIGFQELDYAVLDNVGVPAMAGGGSDPLRSYAVYRHLLENRYDIVHVADYLGIGYYPTLGKRAGLLDCGPIVAQLHGPTAWSMRWSNAPVISPNVLFREAMERGSVQHADAILSPSDYMLSFLREDGWAMPQTVRVIQNVLPKAHSAQAAAGGTAAAGGAVPTLAFFGRLEHRKGLNLFIDALQILQHRAERPFKVLLLGKINDPAYSADMFGLRMSRLDIEWELLDNLNANEALDLLQSTGALAVMPSLSDNIPCTIQECLARGIPFLSTEVGGGAELVAPEDRANCFVPPTAWDVGGALARFVASGGARQRGHIPAAEAARQHADFTRELLEMEAARQRSSVPATPVASDISVCITHRDNPAGLARAIDGFARQTLKPLEIVIGDDHSATPEAQAFLAALPERTDLPFPVRVARSDGARFPAAARNAAAKTARGKWVKFHDDDNVSKPQELDVFSRALAGGSFDLVTCALDFVASDADMAEERAYRRFLFLGDGGAACYIFNVIGDTNFIVDREKFLAAGGFVEDGFLYHAEDWRALVRAKLKGLRIGTVPEALVWYKAEPWRNQTNWRKGDLWGARTRISELVREHHGNEVASLLRLTQGLLFTPTARQAPPPAPAETPPAAPAVPR